MHDEIYRVIGPAVETVTGSSSGGALMLVGGHTAYECVGRPCVIHNPTGHHMRLWPLLWRPEWRMFERKCRHGVGHPDPDQFDYWRVVRTDFLRIHACDGCCVGEVPS